MSYKLKFLPSALKEWKKLDNSVQNQFKNKQWYDVHIPVADRLYKEHLAQLKKEGEI